LQIDTDCHEIVPNDPLAALIAENLERVGPPSYTADEETFARRLQTPVSEQSGTIIKLAIDNEVHRGPRRAGGTGSTDVGDISWRVPTGGFRGVCFASESPGHSWQNVAAIGSTIGEKGTIYAAKVLACTALDLLEEPKHLRAAKLDWQKRMMDRKYVTLIPEGQKAPKSIR